MTKKIASDQQPRPLVNSQCQAIADFTADFTCNWDKKAALILREIRSTQAGRGENQGSAQIPDGTPARRQDAALRGLRFRRRNNSCPTSAPMRQNWLN